MNMQQMMAQAQKMQRELKKAMAALAEQDFVSNKGGLVTVTLKGNRRVESIVIEKDAMDEENKEMIEESIVLDINELNEQISAAEEEINERITGSKAGFGAF